MVLHYGIISVAAITERFLHAIIEAGDTIEAIASRSLEKAQAKAECMGYVRLMGHMNRYIRIRMWISFILR